MKRITRILALTIMLSCTSALLARPSEMRIPLDQTVIVQQYHPREDVLDLWQSIAHFLLIARPTQAAEAGDRFLARVTDDEMIWIFINSPRRVRFFSRNFSRHSIYIGAPDTINAIKFRMRQAVARAAAKKNFRYQPIPAKQSTLDSRDALTSLPTSKTSNPNQSARFSAEELWQHYKTFVMHQHVLAANACGKQLIQYARADEIKSILSTSGTQRWLAEVASGSQGKAYMAVAKQIQIKAGQIAGAPVSVHKFAAK